MLKKCIILIFTLALTVGLCACGGQKTPADTAAPVKTMAPTAKPSAAPSAKPAVAPTIAPTATPEALGNISDVKGFVEDKAQSFDVELDDFGKVRFVSGKLTGGAHVPVEFFLLKENGDIIYRFNAVLPYRVDVRAVSFEDLNGDGKKDVTVIVSDSNGDGGNVAAVYFRKPDGTFENDMKLDSEINSSEKNKDIKMIADYVTAKYK